MDQKPASASRFRSVFRLLLKLLVIAACFWYISGKIDFRQAGATLLQAKPLFLLSATVFFILSKIISALRLNIYFRQTGLSLPEKTNLRLYWLGMFYNLFLPGSVGGDAYKVVLLSRHSKISYKKITAAVLTDRFSGLLALGFLLALTGLFVLPDLWMKSLLCAGAVLAAAAFYFILKRWLRDFLSTYTITLFSGLGVQFSQAVSVYFILQALGNPPAPLSYLFLFFLSSVASVLPLTIGGLGIREIVFLEGAVYFGLPRETAVALSLLFYLITVAVSATGLPEVFRDPLKAKRAHS